MLREQDVVLLPTRKTEQFAPVAENSPNLAIGLLTHYSFDLGGYSASELVNRWCKDYAVNWLRLAIIEALYQGRYKAISVQQILTLWHRRGQVTYHFNVEFESLICSKLPEDLTAGSKTSGFLTPVSDSQGKKSQKVTSLPLKNHPSQTVAPRLKATTQRKLYPSHEQNQHQTSSREDTPPQEKYRSLAPSPQTFISSGSKKRYLPSEKPRLSHSEEFLLKSQSAAVEKLAKFLPSDTNRPPIGQFTPEKSHRSELLTSKLKAIAQEEIDSENDNDNGNK